MGCYIHGIGTALPTERMSQDEVLAMSTEIICEDARQERRMRMLFRRAGVDSRHTAIPWQSGHEWKALPDAINPGHGPRTGPRMRLYAELAVPLAVQAATRALDDAGLQPRQITHLVTVSCTGFDAPGVDVRLIESLGLRPTTQRVHVGYMGCHGAINGMRVVRGLAAADPTARILMCAVEICSLHYRLTWDEEGIIGNALFADGAAALVAMSAPSPQTALWEIQGTGSSLIPDTTDEMSWRIGDHGFEMRLTSQVPLSIKRALRPWIESWLDGVDSSPDAVQGWVIHPGGPKIIDAVEESLELTASQTAMSRGVLRELGNMSSPTILFILERMRKNRSPGPIVTLAFGPGLMVEAAFLQAMDDAPATDE